MIEIDGVHKAYPARHKGEVPLLALKDVTLSIPEGQFFTLIGPSGCGKSTLARAVCGFDHPTLGEVRIKGRPMTAPDSSVVLIWQEFALLEWRTVMGNVELGLEIMGMDRSRRREVAQRLIHVVGLKGFERHYPGELSGGMKQRVAIARCLAVDPEILIMDEPFGALDAQTRLLMQGELLRIWEEFRKTVVFVTHSLEEAVMLSDRVAVLTAAPGRIKAVIEVDLPRPRTPEMRSSPEFNYYYEQLYQLLSEEFKQLSERGERLPAKV